MKKTKQFLILTLIASILIFNVTLVNAQNYKKQNNNQNVLCIVKKGDSLWKISRRHNITFFRIINTNSQFKDPNMIYPGDKVYSPPANKDNNVKQPQDQVEQPQDQIQQPDPQKKEPTNNLKALEAKVVDLVNQERQKRGLKPYKHNSKLSNVARTKSEDMRDKNYFSHTSPTYGSPFEMMRKFNIQFSTAGENIAKGQKTAQQVMNGWMNSPGHRKNILSEKFTEIGVGVAKDSNGMTYWTQMFIRP